jgi:hypothetical protein
MGKTTPRCPLSLCKLFGRLIAMKLNKDFQFSQSSLQDYVDCPYRFKLRYIERMDWPALRTEPVLEHEAHIEAGLLFHNLVHSFLIGIPDEIIRTQAEKQGLLQWWQNFIDTSPFGKPSDTRYAEYRLSMPFAGFRLVAQYDLLVVSSEGKLTILDWKTSQTRTKSKYLKTRLQSLLYPYLLVESGQHLNDHQKVSPEQVEMIYWFSAFPNQPECLKYSAEKHTANRETLLSLVEKIKIFNEADFLKTEDDRHCKFCVYRSYCDRGIQAGNWHEIDDELPGEEIDNLDLTFDDLMEIKF